MRVPRSKPVIPLLIPSPMAEIDAWLVVGLDPSMSRTGYSIMYVGPQASDDKAGAWWLAAGSVKPSEANEPIWVRGKAMASFLRDTISNEFTTLIGYNTRTAWNKDCPNCHGDGYYFEMNNARHECNCRIIRPWRMGLIVSMEYPTPMNDFLVALNRIIHLVFFEDRKFAEQFKAVRMLTVNAATMRSLMNLKMRGSANKKENIVRAYEYISKDTWPSLDTGSCDAVLHAVIAQHAANIMLGYS